MTQGIQSRLNIIFTAFLFSSLVYLLVGFALMKSGWTPILKEDNLHFILFGMFLLFSVILVVVAFQLKNRVDPDARNDRAVFSRSIFLFAIAEAPSIFGLVLFLLTGKFLYLLTFCILSIVAFLLARPRI